MKWSEYQPAAQRTADSEHPDRRKICALGLIGEVAELIKHALSHGEDVDVDNVCWYVAEAWQIEGTVGFTIDFEVCRSSVTTLAIRAACLAANIEENDPAPMGAPTNVRIASVVRSVAGIAAAYGFTLADVLQANIDKLTARHKDGFTVEASKARHEDPGPPLPEGYEVVSGPAKSTKPVFGVKRGTITPAHRAAVYAKMGI